MTPDLCATCITDLDAVSISGAILLTTTWPATLRAIRVGFLDGDIATHTLVAEVASEWNLYSGLPFTFPGVNFVEAAYARRTQHLPLLAKRSGYHLTVTTPEDCDVRVSFALAGFWSYIGASALRVQSDAATMSLAGVHAGMNVYDAKKVILHEFGHALGMVHEHQHPDNGIQWNKEAVYADYVDGYGWTVEEVDAFLFRALSRTTLHAGVYDPDSIMSYGLPAKYTLDGFSVPWPHELSAGDKAFIATIYPTN